MLISMSWLRQYLPAAPDARTAGEALTFAGLNVENFTQVDGDDVIDVEVTSNRPDCLSVLGIARELGAILRLPVSEPDIFRMPASGSTAGEDAFPVMIQDHDLCPHYTARILKNVRVGPSPEWLQRRLIGVGLRPINNIVDITNFVLFELGQPLHAFDLDKLAGPRIVVRPAAVREKLVAIDGGEYTLSPSMLVIADEEKPVAIAGVMGGKESEVTEATHDILLESARFDPSSVRSTSRALALRSDSSYRFERGIDPTLPVRASNRAAQLMVELAGANLVPTLYEAGVANHQPANPTLRLSQLARILGIDVPVDSVMDILARLGFSPRHAQVDGQPAVAVDVPSHRLDVRIESDLIEEVARVHGYDKIPTRDEISIRVAPPQPRAAALEVVRSTLVAAGYFESLTFSWVSDALADDFIPAEAHSLARARHSVRKADGRLRPSLLPGLLESVRRNESVGVSDAHLFETGAVFHNDQKGSLHETRKLALVGSADLRGVRGIVETLLGRLDVSRSLAFRPVDRNGFARGSAATVSWNDQEIGHIGLIASAVADKLSLRHAPAAAELDLDTLLAGHQAVPQLRALPRFPAIRRDLSLVVPLAMRYERIEKLVRDLKPAMLEEIEFVTTYRGKPLAGDQKSVTITLVFRSPTATLTAEQVEPEIQKVIAEAQSHLGAALRT